MTGNGSTGSESELPSNTVSRFGRDELEVRRGVLFLMEVDGGSLGFDGAKDIGFVPPRVPAG